MEQEQPIVLYELDGCPFCAKVIAAMTELDVEYESIMVPSDRSKRTQVLELTGGEAGVPVIQDPNTDEFEYLNDSADIVEYLNRVYG